MDHMSEIETFISRFNKLEYLTTEPVSDFNPFRNFNRPLKGIHILTPTDNKYTKVVTDYLKAHPQVEEVKLSYM